MTSYDGPGGIEIHKRSILPEFVMRIRQGKRSQSSQNMSPSEAEILVENAESHLNPDTQDSNHSERPLLLRGKALMAYGLFSLLAVSVGSQFLNRANEDSTSSDLKIRSTVCLAAGTYHQIPKELSQRLVKDDLKGIYGFFERYFTIHNLYGKMTLDEARDIVASGTILAEDIQYAFVNNHDGSCTLLLVYLPTNSKNS